MTNYNKEAAAFSVEPISADECDAAQLLADDPVRAEAFFDGLREQPDGTWSVNFRRGQTDYVLRASNVRSLALSYLAFDPQKFKAKQEAARKTETEARLRREAAERAEQSKRDTLRRSLLGGGL